MNDTYISSSLSRDSMEVTIQITYQSAGFLELAAFLTHIVVQNGGTN